MENEADRIGSDHVMNILFSVTSVYLQQSNLDPWEVFKQRSDVVLFSFHIDSSLGNTKTVARVENPGGKKPK